MRVRPLTDADLDRCIDLFDAVAAEGRWLATEPPIDHREVRARWRALLDTGEGTLLVAEDEGAAEPLGLAAMVGRTSPELGMLVAAGHRRRGVGDALLETWQHGPQGNPPAAAAWRSVPPVSLFPSASPPCERM